MGCGHEREMEVGQMWELSYMVGMATRGEWCVVSVAGAWSRGGCGHEREVGVAI